METNPRIQGEWSPPPAVVVVPQPPPRPRVNLEEDFETTLGGLVEHFANLPPARYGEPPDLVSDLGPQLASHAPNRRSWNVVWVTACAVVLGGGIALGSYLGWSYLRRPEPRSTLVKPVTPDVGKIKIVVKTPPTKGVPQAEPLVDDRAAATPVAAPSAVPAVKDDLDEETPTVRREPVKPKPIVRKIRRQRRVAKPVGAAATGAGGDGWEDPYR
jgi:hypothetical protein